jgi:hypothetical protein
MSDKKIIAVVGATGAQGGGPARAVLDFSRQLDHDLQTLDGGWHRT